MCLGDERLRLNLREIFSFHLQRPEASIIYLFIYLLWLENQLWVPLAYLPDKIRNHITLLVKKLTIN